MAQKQAVIVCGYSLFMAGVAVNVEKDEILHVIKTIDLAEIRQILRSVRPKAIIVDRAETEWSCLAALNREHPGIAIIALDHENNMASIYSCHQEQVATIQDVKEIVLKYRS